MKRIIGVGLLAALAGTPMALAAPLACDTLKAAINGKIRDNGVREYWIEVVEASAEHPGKVVGSCEGGTRKIVYIKGLKARGVASATARPTAQASQENTVDERGFINVWTLRKAAIALASMPTGEDNCGYEGDGEEEEPPKFKSRSARLAYERRIRKQQQQAQRSIAKCERAQERIALAHTSALTSFNQTWKPALIRATELGDPVAEVVLRLCETVPILDRTGIAADCSDAPPDKAIARQRLEAIGFKPALHNYTVTDYFAFEAESRQFCSSLAPEKQAECELRAEVQRHSRVLEVLQTGYAGVAASRAWCLYKHPDPEVDKVAEECQRLHNLGLVVAATLPRFYTSGPLEQQGDLGYGLSLARPILSGASGKPEDAERYQSGVVKRYDGSDYREFSDPNFQAKFYSDLDRITQSIESNIDADLRKDPRWAVFLIERLTGRLFDAMNKSDPNRPSVAEIKSHEAQNPRRNAEKAAKEEADWRNRWLNADTQELIDSLHFSRNTSLYYSRDSFPFNLKEIERRNGIVPALVQAYHADRDDPVFRFNVILVLAHKIETNGLSQADLLLAGKCLEFALGDSHPWVRTEAAWGLRYTNDAQYCPALKPLLEDADQWISSEASQSFSSLGCQFESVVPYSRMN